MVSVNVKNIKGVEEAFAKYGEEAVKEFVKITRFKANETENTAKTLAPIDNGTLRQSIHTTESEKGLTQNVGTRIPYAPYMEFGTGTLVKIQDGWGEMAARFKGAGIRQINIRPRPFMYPAFVYARKTFAKDIKKSLKDLSNKFNKGSL